MKPGRLGGAGGRRARALLAAGLFGEADERAGRRGRAVRRRRLSRTTPRRCGPGGGGADGRRRGGRRRGPGAAGVPEPRQRRWAASAALLALRARSLRVTSASARLALAAPARAAGRHAGRLGLPEDSRRPVSSPSARWSSPGGSGPPSGGAAGTGRRARPTGSSTRLLWRLSRAEHAAGRRAGRAGRPGSWSRGWRRCTATASSWAAWTCRPAPRCTGARWPGPASTRRCRTGRRPRSTAGRSGPGRRRCCCRRYARRRIPTPPRRWRNCARYGSSLRERRAGGPAGGRPARAGADTLQRSVREHSWSAAGPGEGAGTGADPRRSAVRAELGDAALVAYCRRPGAARARRGGPATPSRPGRRGTPDAEEAVLRLRADLDAQAGRQMPRPARGGGRRRHPARRRGAAADAVLGPILRAWSATVTLSSCRPVCWCRAVGVAARRAGRPVTVAPSATTWLAARARRRGDPSPATGDAVLVAGPD